MTRTNQTIQVTYWQKARLKNLTPEEKLVELFLMTCPECGPSGSFRMDTSSIAYDIGLTEPKVKDILKSLEDKKRVFKFEGNWLLVRGKFEYEPTKSDKIKKCVEGEVSIAPKPLIERFLTLYDTLWDTLPDRLKQSLFPTNTITNTKTNTPEVENLPDSKYSEFVLQLFPDTKKSKIKKQAETLDKIVRIDGASWEYLKQVLRWAVKDDFWSGNFLSCAPLRTSKPAGDAMKYEKIIKSYQKATGRKLQGYMCAECGYYYLTEQKVCSNCGGISFKDGKLPDNWKQLNQERKIDKTHDKKSSDPPVKPEVIRKSLDKITDKMKRGE